MGNNLCSYLESGRVRGFGTRIDIFNCHITPFFLFLHYFSQFLTVRMMIWKLILAKLLYKFSIQTSSPWTVPLVHGENSREGKKCLTCRPGISSCVHWDFVVDSINTEARPDIVIDIFEFCRTVNGQHMSPRGPKCLSYRKIPVTKFGWVKDTSDIPDVLSTINETGLCPFCEEDLC